MKDKHESWRLCRFGDGYLLEHFVLESNCYAQIGSGTFDYETANKIVVSVNACAGISDENLADDCVRKMREDRNYLLAENTRLKAQRDELLVAVKALTGDDKPCGHKFFCVCPGQLAEAAIAKAEALK